MGQGSPKLTKSAKRQLKRKLAKDGKPASYEELIERHYKVQVTPMWMRLATGVVAAVPAFFAYSDFVNGSPVWGCVCGAVAMVLALVAIYGRREDLESVLESAAEGVAEASIDAVFDALS